MSSAYKKGLNIQLQYLPLAILCLIIFLGAAKPEEDFLEGSLVGKKILEKVMALEARISNLSQKVDEMEKRLSKLEKAPPPQETSFLKDEEPKNPIVKSLSEKIKSPPVDIDIGHGFKGVNVRYETSFSDTLFTGEIENNIGDRDFVHFHLEAYNKEGKVIGKGGFQFMRLTMGSREPFELTIRGLDAKDIERYTITCVRGF